MTAQQINTILFWTTLGIVAFSLSLVYAAQKFGEKLAREAKAKKSAKSVSSLRGVPRRAGRRGNLKPKRKEVK